MYVEKILHWVFRMTERDFEMFRTLKVLKPIAMRETSFAINPSRTPKSKTVKDS